MILGNDELAGVATLPQFRRMGVAATLSSFLVAQHFANRADIAWLSASHDAAVGVYARIGFRPAAEQLNYSDC